MSQSREVKNTAVKKGESRFGSEEVRRKAEELKAAIEAQKSKEK